MIGDRGTHSKKPNQQSLHRVVSGNPTDPRYKDADGSVYNAGMHLLDERASLYSSQKHIHLACFKVVKSKQDSRDQNLYYAYWQDDQTVFLRANSSRPVAYIKNKRNYLRNNLQITTSANLRHLYAR